MISALRRWLHGRRYPRRHAWFTELMANARLSRAELLAQQRRAIEATVTHAALTTPYYERRYAGLDLRDFASLPVLAKQDVVDHLDELLSRAADRRAAHIGHTGGSTGKPLAFWYDEAKHELMRAGMMRSYTLSGWRPGQKILNFWGAPQDVVAGGVFGRGYAGFVAAERTISAYGYTGAQLAEWARAVQRYRPVLLQGYASILAELARHVLERRIAMPDSLIGVYSTAEVLDDESRALMERAFGCKVFNQYGSREIPNIACECRHGRMHVFTDMVALESQPGDGGEHLLVSSLTNRLMPMIRYDIGDSGRLVAGDCPCGLPFPLMEMGICRQNDLIRLPGGRTLHPAYFNRLLYGRTNIRNYQWVQSAPAHIRLDVVCPEPVDDAIVRELAERLGADLGGEIEFELRRVPTIERTRSGKHRFVVSELADGR